MRIAVRLTLAAAFAALILSAGSTADMAFAQKGADKRSACIAKARAENPDRMAGNARNAAFARCMRGG